MNILENIQINLNKTVYLILKLIDFFYSISADNLIKSKIIYFFLSQMNYAIMYENLKKENGNVKQLYLSDCIVGNKRNLIMNRQYNCYAF